MEGDIEGPWYRDNQTNPPFLLTTCFKNLRSLEYRFVSLFPWNLTSLPSHHYGRSENGWRELIETYAGSVVVGNAEELFLVWALQPGGRQRKQIRFNTEVPPITAVAWALSQGEDSLDALLVIAVSRMVCVYSVGKGKVVGFLRGHGGSISSIAVHPQTPSHICTTSSDQTARIYDLDRSPDPKFPQVNPFLVPGTGPSMAGAPHGIRSAEEEEWTKGLCIAILVGGRSGGHLAAVTCAAFHPTFPLIATGGMDRVVKIWRLHDYKGQILREDKPLFSSSLIHRSSVASIVWLAQDTLLTHCVATDFSVHKELPREQQPQEEGEERTAHEWFGPPREQQPQEEEEERTAHEWFGSPGRIVIFRWLALNRFFPPKEARYPTIQRGCVSDYQESSSFTVLASIPLPYYPHTPHLRVFGDVYHDHIVLIVYQRTLRLLNTSHAPRVETSEFPTSPEQFPVDFMPHSRRRAEEKVDAKCLEDNDWVRGLGWCINLDPRFAVDEQVKAVDMGLNGELIVAVGSKGSTWVWMKDM